MRMKQVLVHGATSITIFLTLQSGYNHLSKRLSSFRKTVSKSSMRAAAACKVVSKSGGLTQSTSDSEGRDNLRNADTKDTKEYAYAFFVGGIHATHLNTPPYNKYLYGVLVAVRALKQLGSTGADFVLFVQLAHDCPADKIPEEFYFHKLGVRVMYVPKPAMAYASPFDRLVLEKFRILTLTEYRRVLFLDADVLPLGNLDYWFHLSDDRRRNDANTSSTTAIIKPTLLIAGHSAPANAGVFMIEPLPGDWVYAECLIAAQDDRLVHGTREWDQTDQMYGWGGHKIEGGDYWESRTGIGYTWTFSYAPSDQGLLYYWGKYFKKSVSLYVNNNGTAVVNNWSMDLNGTLCLEKKINDPFRLHPQARPILECDWCCKFFMCDLMHFSAGRKPWKKENVPPPNAISIFAREVALHSNLTNEVSAVMHSPADFWYYTLTQLNQEFSMGLNLTNMEWT